ncbi:hypothetical protein BDV96DRAFT_639699 [Lophiotrema nucula]|uniref:Uncharacterized protein n=1 Tax=Lophiotrema nucula TaxID=690887 RepID=A0A6A5ZTW5_9PLEO|nr:hypothetical protein BDV96DRAFT_639699 [Lophiotrema nucula]
MEGSAPEEPSQARSSFNPAAASFEPRPTASRSLPPVPQVAIPAKQPVAVVGIGGNVAPGLDTGRDTRAEDASDPYSYGMGVKSAYSYLNERAGFPPRNAFYAAPRAEPKPDDKADAKPAIATADSGRGHRRGDPASTSSTSSNDTIIAPNQPPCHFPPAGSSPEGVSRAPASTVYPIPQLLSYLPPHITASALASQSAQAPTSTLPTQSSQASASTLPTHSSQASAQLTNTRDEQRLPFSHSTSRPPTNAPKGPRGMIANPQDVLESQIPQRAQAMYYSTPHRRIGRIDQGPQPSAADIYPEDSPEAAFAVNANSRAGRTAAPPPPAFHPLPPKLALPAPPDSPDPWPLLPSQAARAQVARQVPAARPVPTARPISTAQPTVIKTATPPKPAPKADYGTPMKPPAWAPPGWQPTWAPKLGSITPAALYMATTPPKPAPKADPVTPMKQRAPLSKVDPTTAGMTPDCLKSNKTWNPPHPPHKEVTDIVSANLVKRAPTTPNTVQNLLTDPTFPLRAHAEIMRILHSESSTPAYSQTVPGPALRPTNATSAYSQTVQGPAPRPTYPSVAYPQVVQGPARRTAISSSSNPQVVQGPARRTAISSSSNPQVVQGPARRPAFSPSTYSQYVQDPAVRPTYPSAAYPQVVQDPARRLAISPSANPQFVRDHRRSPAISSPADLQMVQGTLGPSNLAPAFSRTIQGPALRPASSSPAYSQFGQFPLPHPESSLSTHSEICEDVPDALLWPSPFRPDTPDWGMSVSPDATSSPDSTIRLFMQYSPFDPDQEPPMYTTTFATYPMTEDQYTGEKYGLAKGGLGLESCGDIWTPPSKEPEPPLVVKRGEKDIRSLWME